MKVPVTNWDVLQAVLLDFHGIATVHEVARVCGIGDDVAGRLLEQVHAEGILVRQTVGKTKVRVFQAPEAYVDPSIFQIPAVILPTSSDYL